MKHLLSLIEKSVANDKWTKFVEILEKKGTHAFSNIFKKIILIKRNLVPRLIIISNMTYTCEFLYSYYLS